jgi:hypothetical protein
MKLSTITGLEFGAVLSEPASAGQHPVILFLHGVMEKGDGSPTALIPLENFVFSDYNNIKKGLETIFPYNGKNEEFILLAPQLPSAAGEWDNAVIDAAINHLLTLPEVDPNRIYLAGVSLGGGGAIKYLSVPGNGQKFAAALIVCPAYASGFNYSVIAGSKCPVLFVHAQDDLTCPVTITNNAVTGINSYNPSIPAYKVILTTGGHYVWVQAFDPVNLLPGLKTSVWVWFLMNTKTVHAPVPTGTVSPTNPTTMTVDAGIDQTISGTTATLDGSKSTGYKNAWWVQESFNGKTPTIEYWANATSKGWGAKVDLKGLIAGTYVYKLSVSDGTTTLTDTVKLTVSSAPAPAPTPTPTPIPIKKQWASITLKSGKVMTIFDDDTTSIL